jgi:hypothetical protein
MPSGSRGLGRPNDYESIPDFLTLSRSAATEKLGPGVGKLNTDIRNSVDFISKFGEPYRQGETITTAFEESTNNQGACRRFVKEQRMQWTPRVARLRLQARTKVLHDAPEGAFRGRYPHFRAEDA